MLNVFALLHDNGKSDAIPNWICMYQSQFQIQSALCMLIKEWKTNVKRVEFKSEV